MAIKTRETTATGVTNKGSPLTNAEVDNNFVELQQNKLDEISEDSTPQLGGNLDLNSSDITGTGNLDITGNIAVTGTVDGRDVAADGTKLDGIESGATADQTDAEIRAAVDSATDSNVFTDADHSKLDGIEASADVTDTVNVTAAGALMDSEVTNLDQVKTFDSSDYATAAQGTTADSALQNVVEDTTPQLGGNLDFNGNTATSFTSTGIDDNATSTAITIDSSERVGIGTTSASALLQIGDATTVDANSYLLFGKRVSSTETNLPFIGQDDVDGGGHNDLGLGARSTNGSINFYAGNNPAFTAAYRRMTIASNGKVTIGTPSQGTHELSVREGGSPRITIDDTGGTDTDVNAALLLRADTTNKGVVGYVGSDDLFVENKTAAGRVLLGTNDLNRLVVESSGTVLIQNGSGLNTNGNLTLAASSSGNEGGQINFNTVSSGTYSIDTHTDNMRFLNGTTAGDYFWYKNSNAAIGMTLTGSGNLGVNTAPSTELHIYDSSPTASTSYTEVKIETDSANNRKAYTTYVADSTGEVGAIGGAAGGTFVQNNTGTCGLTAKANGTIGLYTNGSAILPDVSLKTNGELQVSANIIVDGYVEADEFRPTGQTVAAMTVASTGALTTGNDMTVSESLTVGDGTNTATHIAIKPADDTTADDLQFYNGTTRMGEIGTQDTTWLRINQSTAKNIYTPRYFRADGGFFVDGTSKGINGSGNFIGGTVTTPTLNINDGNTQMTEGNGNAFRLATDSGYVDVGPQNSGFCHIKTDRAKFYVNATTEFDGGGIRAYDTSADARFPIYYDSQNTAYYSDPASTSRLNVSYNNETSHFADHGRGVKFWNTDSYKIYMSAISNSTWGGDVAGSNASDYAMYFRMSGGTNRGFIFRNNTTNVAKIDGNGVLSASGVFGTSTYLDVKYNASGAGGVRLYDSDSTIQGTWYGNGSGEHGFLDNDGAWAVRIRTGTEPLQLRTNNNNELMVYTSYVRAVGSCRSPIFYDMDNTSYYADFGSTGDSIRAAGDIVAFYSDERLKDIEGNITNALDKVSTLNGFYYRGNEKAQKLGYDDKRKVGLSAQEVQKVLPEIIKSCPADNQYMTLDYSKVVPLLVEAIKELKAEIEELKK